MKLNILTYFTLCFLCTIDFGKTAKILGVFPLVSKSLHILGHELMKGLAEKGHEVVLVTCHPEEVPSNLKYRQVLLTGIYADEVEAKRSNFFDVVSPNMVHQTIFLNNFGKHLSGLVFEHPNVKDLLASNQTFDLVIVQQFFVDSLKVFAWHYKAPLILFSTIGANTWFNGLMGNPAPPSYVPEALSEFTSEMNFCERMKNSFLRVFVELYLNFFTYPAHNEIMHKYFSDAPHIDEILYNASLVLINSDLSFNQPVPKVPNMIDIGGFHIRPSKKLPKELQEFLDEAKDGVIYFSMGSNLKSAQLPKATKDFLLRVFAKLKQKVLWKFEEDLLGKPSNVEIRKWFPQQDILGHPNVKLFISHGGLLSTIESIYHAVPILAIPVFGDQRLNAKRTAQKELGLYIYYTNLTESYFEDCLDKLSNTDRYVKKAKQLSRIFHDRPMTPMDTANFWVNYVIRHQGAPHLRVAALKMNIFQYLLLDVIAFILFAIFGSALILKYLLTKMKLTRKNEALKIKKN